MYYRRKIILALIEASGGKLEKFRLHKLLFLLAQEQEKPAYEFVPYRFGVFSFTANSDLVIMTGSGEVKQSGNDWNLLSVENWMSQLKATDKSAIAGILVKFGGLSTDELIRYTYAEYPWYTQNSEIIEKVLNEPKPVYTNGKTEAAFFTIGYEGKSLEAYLNLLLENNVKLLCDVRRNAYSMKYGFSKAQLQKACEGIGIKYMHLPEFGIASADRKELNSPEDYQALFAEYDKGLSGMNEELQKFFKLIETEKRVAITCFEADQCNCHRGRLAKKLSETAGWNLEPKHI